MILEVVEDAGHHGRHGRPHPDGLVLDQLGDAGGIGPALGEDERAPADHRHHQLLKSADVEQGQADQQRAARRRGSAGHRQAAGPFEDRVQRRDDTSVRQHRAFRQSGRS